MNKSVILDEGWEIEDPFYQKLYLKAEPLLNVRFNTLHTRICYHLALKLLATAGGNPRIVLPAILFHDIGYSQLDKKEIKCAFGPKLSRPDLRRRHEIEGACLAGELLEEIGYPAHLVPSIQSIIDGHDTRATAHDINDMVVRDADKLWRFTRVGFFFNYSWLDMTPKANLDRLKGCIPNWFFTEPARIIATAEAEDRQKDIMQDFYDFTPELAKTD